MEGKILKNFILASGIWTVTIMSLIVYSSGRINNIWNSIMVLIGLVILYFLVNTFIIVYFSKKNPK